MIMIQLRFNDTTIQFQIVGSSNSTSKHSGKNLQFLQIQTNFQGKQASDQFLKLISLAKDDGVTSVDENGSNFKRWKIGNTSWSYTEGTPIYRHSLEIQELEEIKIASLAINDLIIDPYLYHEHFDDECLHIRAKATLTKEQHESLKIILKEKDEVNVIRHGINETSRRMFLSSGYWSEEGGVIKHEINLTGVEEKRTNNNVFASLRFALRSVPYQAAETQALLDGLLTALENKGILVSDEITQIRESALDAAWENRYRFFRVDDLDAC